MAKIRDGKAIKTVMDPVTVAHVKGKFDWFALSDLQLKAVDQDYVRFEGQTMKAKAYDIGLHITTDTAEKLFTQFLALRGFLVTRTSIYDALADALTLDWQDNGNIMAEAVRDRCLTVLADVAGVSLDDVLADIEKRADKLDGDTE